MALLKEDKRVLIDLRYVESATAAASLILFAIVNRAQLLKGSSDYATFRLPHRERNPDGYRWIVKTGLARALKSGSRQKLEELSKDQNFFQSSDQPSEHVFKTIAMLQSKAQFNTPQLRLLAGGITEAALNVSHHAYDDPAYQDQLEIMGKRWWQCAWFDPESDTVFFIIFDLGIGVFNSLRSGTSAASLPSSIQEEVSVLNDSFKLGVSRYKDKPERGRGSEDIKSPIHQNCSQMEKLLVYTGRASYVYSKYGESVGGAAGHLVQYMPGTLVQWQLSPNRRGGNDSDKHS
ncbi:hypothetical protein [Salinivibrio sp. KP-1]|uniref:hypothetical protein n=1 Tax=Salinivibrio sp. KP-1 TaxID=1406902 RepID=UPI000696F145|nr:hypothetical protein [Salinivibrio sp. KP-1]